MIKNNQGVTIVILVVAVVLLLILAGVGLNMSFSSVDKVKDSKWETELGMVRQAVTEQYWKASSVGKTGISMGEGNVSFWIGNRIMNFSEIDLPNKNTVKVTEESEAFFSKADSYAPVYQEDYYYRLMPTQLKEIGIQEAEATYVVNYATGEVYNETQKKDSKSQLLYLPQTNQKMTDALEKDDTFSDWNE